MMNSDLCILTFNPETKTRLGTCHPRYSQPYISEFSISYQTFKFSETCFGTFEIMKFARKFVLVPHDCFDEMQKNLLEKNLPLTKAFNAKDTLLQQGE